MCLGIPSLCPMILQPDNCNTKLIKHQDIPLRSQRLLLNYGNGHHSANFDGHAISFKDICAHCYCVRYSLGTHVLRHTSSTCTEQNTLTKCSADGCCVNLVREYFWWMHGDPHFFLRRSLPFLILSIITKKNLCVGSFNYFTFTIHMGSNCYINTGVRDLEVALFKAIST